MSESIQFTRDIPVRHDVDVFVAGGGPAGVAAAAVAARQGRSVFLAEGHSCLGGMGTAGLVPAFMQFGDGANFLAAGVGEELLDRLLAAGGVGPRYDPARRARGSICINAETLKRVYDEFVTEAGVNFALHTNLIAVDAEAGHVRSAICAAKSGLFAVQARVYIDATGDGDLAAWAGAPFEKGDAEGTMMPGTLCSLWADVDWQAVDAGGLGSGGSRLDEAIADGLFSQEDHHLPGMWIVGERTGGGNIGHAFGVDGTDERSLTEALVDGRKLVLEYERYFKEYLRGFEHMQLMATGSLMGLRETRRIMGDYVLCLDDFKTRAVFDDEIGRYSYPVDIHPTRPGQDEYARFMDEWTNLRYGKGESYGVPYRVLLPQGLTNVLVAGRCISCDRAMQGSIRVMPGCYITGQACGMAASMAVEQAADPRSLNVSQLRQRLIQIGAYLP